VALQKLHRHSDARHEFSQTESAVQHATKTALSSFEHAMRYPPLYDLAALEHLQSLTTFNSLQRKLYRSTAPLAPLPVFLFPDSKAAEALPIDASATARLPGGQYGMESELTKLPMPQLPVIPIGRPIEGSGGSLADRADAMAGGAEGVSSSNHKFRGSVELRAMEERLRGAVRRTSHRRRVSNEVETPEPPSERSSMASTMPQPPPGAAVAAAARSSEPQGELDGQEPIFSNSIAYLYPPIHPAELPSWSTLHELPKFVKAQAAKEKAASEERPEEGPHAPRPPPQPQEDKERIAEEGAAASEAEVDAEKKIRDEEGEKRDVMPDIIYGKLMMDTTRICAGCAVSQNLRSQSSLWPEDNHTHSLMPASPMALPLAVPIVLPDLGERQLSDVCFNELLHYQENYGTAESLLSMLVREHRLSQACYYIFNEKVSKRLFVDVVAHHCLAHNQFHELQKVILAFDPSLRRVQEYLNVLKEFLRNRRALDLLYSYQVFTKDYVNAGLLAIQLFIASNTWDARVGHLQNAFAHLTIAQKQLLSRKKGHHVDPKEGSGADGSGQGSSSAHDAADGATYGAGSETMVDGISGLEITEADIRRNLETVRLQMAVCEAMPTEMPHHLDLFGSTSSQCEIAERLLVAGHYDLAQRHIDFLDLPAVELCVRASNQIATVEARCASGSITPVVKFLEAVRKLPPVEWDSLVSNVVNIWIIEKTELRWDASAASQLIKFIQDERCRMDAHVLLGNLTQAFQIAQRLGNLQDVLHIRSCAQKSGDQELLKHINSFLAYASPGKDYLKKNLNY